MIDPDVKLRSNPRCILTELEDRTGVLLNIDTKFYFTLNDTGVFLWKQLAQGPCSSEELAQRLSSEFDVSSQQALPDVQALVAELEANRLIQRDAP